MPGTNDTGQQAEMSRRARVFISYSRRDAAFAVRLVEALERRGIEPRIDTRDLPTLEDWRRELLDFIREADAVVFIVSAASISSPVCAWEVEQVSQLNKRLAPVVLERVAEDRIPEGIGRINYLYFDPPHSFETQADKLARALSSDLGWVKEHTRLGEWARRWSEREQSSVLLLRGQELVEAERWIKTRPRDAPEPTTLHRDLIEASRRGAGRRRVVWISSGVTAVAVAAMLTVMIIANSREAELQKREAQAKAIEAENSRRLEEDQRRIADAARLGAETQRQESSRREAAAVEQANRKQIEHARYLAELSRQHAGRHDYASALALALEALPRRAGDAEPPVTAEARAALNEALARNREAAVLGGHPDAVVATSFAPDGRKVVTAAWGNATTGGSDFRVRVWAVPTGKLLVTFDRHRSNVCCATFSPDGTHVLTASADKTARIWDAQSGAEVQLFAGHQDTIRAAIFSSDGRLVATASDDGTARIWDSVGGKLLHTLKRPGESVGVRALAFSEDGRWLLTGMDDGSTGLWDAARGREIRTLAGHKERVRLVAFTSDGGTIATGSTDGTVKLWETDSGRELRAFDLVEANRRGYVTGAQFFPNDVNILVASAINAAWVLNVERGREVAALRGHTGPIEAVAIAPDGRRVVTASRDGSARIWSLIGEELAVLQGHTSPLASVAFSPAGQVIATGARDGTARLWWTDVDRFSSSYPGGSSLMGEPFAVARDGRHIVIAHGEEPNSATVWDTADRKVVAVLSGHANLLLTAKLSPDGSRVVTTSSDGTAKVWEPVTGKLLASFGGHRDIVFSASFSPDGSRVATSGNDGALRIWNARSGAELLALRFPDRRLTWAEFAPDRRRIVTVEQRTPGSGKELFAAVVRDAETGRELFSMARHDSIVNMATYSPDGRLIATAAQDRTVRLWDAESGQQLHILRGHTGNVRSAAFSPDSRLVVTAADDNSARIFSAVTGEVMAMIGNHASGVSKASFSSDGRSVFTLSLGLAGKGMAVRQWPYFADVHDMIAHACTLMPRPLSIRQREDLQLNPDPKDPPCGRKPR